MKDAASVSEAVTLGTWGHVPRQAMFSVPGLCIKRGTQNHQKGLVPLTTFFEQCVTTPKMWGFIAIWGMITFKENMGLH